MKLTVKKVRAYAQMANVQGTITVGTVIKVRDYMIGEYNGRPADQLICEHQGGILRLSVNEYFRLHFINDRLFDLDEEGNVEIHTQFEVVDIKDRTDLNGDIIYPHAAYNGYMFEEPEEDTYEFQELKDSGLNTDWTYGCLKNYSVRTI